MMYDNILDYVNSVGSNSLSVFGGSFEGGYQLQQVPEEISKMIFDLKKDNIKIENYCEIGAASHGLTRLMVDLFDIKSVVTIDLGLDWPGKENNINAIKEKTSIHIINGDSHTFPFFNNCFCPIFDFVVIDGDHSYEGVKNDYRNVVKYLKKDGHIMFHDTENVYGIDVNKFNEELKLTSKDLLLTGEYKETSNYKGIALWKKKA